MVSAHVNKITDQINCVLDWINNIMIKSVECRGQMLNAVDAKILHIHLNDHKMVDSIIINRFYTVGYFQGLTYLQNVQIVVEVELVADFDSKDVNRSLN